MVNASSVKDGATNTSKNISLIAFAVSTSIVLLQTNTPPNALSGSPARAFCQAPKTVVEVATPHTLVCFIIANKASASSKKSAFSCIAASTSTRLL